MKSRAKPLLFLALLVLLGGGILLASAASREPRSAFAGPGSPAHGFVDDARALGFSADRLLSSPLLLSERADPEPSKTLLVVLGPPKDYSQAESDYVQTFLERGGRLLVADDFGSANSLTTGLGVSFERVRLVESDASAPVEAHAGGRTFQLRLDVPTGLKIAPETSAEVLAASSNLSFLDRGGDGAIDASDPRGPFPIVAELLVGERGGRLVAVSDTAPFLESEADPGDNHAWRRALLSDLLPEGGTVLLDESREPSHDPALRGVGSLVGAATSAPWKYVLWGLGLLVLLLILRPQADPSWGPHRFRPHRFVRRAAPNAPPDAPPPSIASFWTWRGMTALAAGVGLAALALALGSVQAGYLSGVLLIAAAAARLYQTPRVEAERQVDNQRPPESASIHVRLDLRSHGRGSAPVEFRDALPPEFDCTRGTPWFQSHLPSRSGATVEYTASPALRGPYEVGPLVVRRSDPLSLHVQESTVAPATSVRVSPREEQVRKIPFRAKVPSITLGPHLVNRAGEGSEFHSLRGYQVGDSLRSVNWKASARSKDLVVNQRVHESFTEVTLFLDARGVSGNGPASTTPIAAGCRAVLSLASAALRVRDRVRLVLYGDGLQEIEPQPGAQLTHELLELLSKVPARGEMPFADAVRRALPGLRPRTPVLLVSGLESDPTILEGLRLLRSRGLLPIVLALPIGTQPVDPEDGAPEPDAEKIESGRDALIAQIRAEEIPLYKAAPNLPLDHLFRLGGIA